MKKLIYKEIRLALHPAAIIFLFLSAMLLIPNYPYYVAFFYTCLGIFFICLNGRENKDIEFMSVLPVRKREAVKARFLLTIILELAQLLLAVPFAWIQSHIIKQPNAVGMDANIALFGVAFLLLGVFNFVFFSRYYKNPSKVGGPFLWGCAVFTCLMVIAEASVHVIPFLRDCIDTLDPGSWEYKLVVLAAGAVLYAVLTWSAYIKSAKSFEKLDI